jgi:hypothetical protein
MCGRFLRSSIIQALFWKICNGQQHNEHARKLAVGKLDHEFHEYTNSTNAFLEILIEIRAIRPFVAFVISLTCC